MKTLLFLDFSGGEFFLIAVVFLMFFGSKSIPNIARTLGKAVRDFKDAAGDVQREIQESANVNLKDIDLNSTVSAPKPPQLPSVVTRPASAKTDGGQKPEENKTGV